MCGSVWPLLSAHSKYVFLAPQRLFTMLSCLNQTDNTRMGYLSSRYVDEGWMSVLDQLTGRIYVLSSPTVGVFITNDIYSSFRNVPVGLQGCDSLQDCVRSGDSQETVAGHEGTD